MLSNMNISATSKLITIKFNLKRHLVKETAALGFGADQIRTMASITNVTAHRAIMGKTAVSCFLDCFDLARFILAGNDHIQMTLNEIDIWPDSTMDYEVSCP